MYDKPFVGTRIDYSDPENWLSLPSATDKDFDLIYLYPSVCMNPDTTTICPIDEPTMREGGARLLAQQASAFEPTCNIFAPWWRQVNLTHLPNMTFEAIDEAEYSEPRTDVYGALDYYFENLNDGRPFFIAGHSQGSRLTSMVLSEYMRVHPERYELMVAAYLIGDLLTRSYLAQNPHLKAAQGADDFGVCVSWNTEGAGNKGKASLVLESDSIAINPLNWRTDAEPAGPELNLGTFVPHLEDHGLDELTERADAVLDLERGSVIVSNPQLSRYSVGEDPDYTDFAAVFGPASFHFCDYSFFYNNIRENARVRAEAWNASHKAVE